MNDIENKELVIIPEKKIEPNQESITQTYNELYLIIKSILLIALVMLIINLISGIISLIKIIKS